MTGRMLHHLRRFAEGVAALLLAVIFVAFIAQIVLRYVFDWPVGWTTELSLAAWLWLVLWGASFVLRDEEEIRLDLLVNQVGPRARRVLIGAGALVTGALFALSVPASWDYVTFMKVETSSYLKIRMDVVYSIYIAFAVAVVVRCLIVLVRAVRGTLAPPSSPADGSASAL